MMKRFIALSLSVLLVLTSLLTPAFAVAPADFYLQGGVVSYSESEDQEVKVSLKTSESFDFSMFEGTITSSDERVTLSGFEHNAEINIGASDNEGIVTENGETYGYILWDGSANPVTLEKDGVVWTAIFTVQKGTPIGLYDVSFTDVIVAAGEDLEETELNLSAKIEVKKPADPANPQFEVYYDFAGDKADEDTDNFYEVTPGAEFSVDVFVKADSAQDLEAFDIYPTWDSKIEYVSITPAEGVSLITTEMKEDNPHFYFEFNETQRNTVSVDTAGKKIATLKLKLDTTAVYDTPYGIYFDSDTNMARASNAESVSTTCDTSGESFGVETRISYTVKYNDNVTDAEISVPAPATKGYNAELLLDFDNVGGREGYTFAGWTETEGGTTAEYTSASDAAKKFTKNGTQDKEIINLYAVWTPNKYTATWNNYDGTFIKTTDVLYNQKPNYDGETPTRADDAANTYTFVGWATTQNATSGTAAADLPVATGNVTYYAAFAPTVRTYDVVFHMNGHGGSDQTKTVAYNTKVEAVTPATVTGYTFGGWYTDSACSDGKEFNFDTFITDNTELYAKWTANEVKVTLNANGGKVTGDEETLVDSKDIYVTYDGEYGELPTPVREGYAFLGWYDKVEGGNKVANTDKVTNANEHHLYAYWDAYKYTVTFHANNNTEEANKVQNFVYGTKQNLLENTYSKPDENHIFAGWALTSSGEPLYGDKDYVGNLTNVNNANVDLYAIWTQNQYEISYTSGHDDVPTDAMTTTGLPTVYTKGVELPITAVPTTTGYKFVGWTSTALKIDTPVMTVTVPNTQTGNVDLVAHWTIMKFTVTFTDKDSTILSFTEVEYNKAVTKPADPEKNGYDFDGWYKDPGLTTEYSFTSAITEATKVYAKWTPTVYDITYELNGGTNAQSNPVTYTIETETITLADPEKTGHNFAGWYIGENKITEIAKGDTGKKTITAQWNVNKYNVEFVTGTTGSINSITDVEYTSQVTLPDGSDLNKPGYVVEGWTDVENGTDVKYPIGANSALTTQNNVTVRLYPVWTEATYNLTFDLGTEEKYYDTKDQGNIAIPNTKIEVTYNEVYPTLPEVVMNPGYEFVGWFDGETPIVAGAQVQITGDTKLTAKYNAIKYTITFDLDGGEWKEEPNWTTDVSFDSSTMKLTYTVESTAVLPEAKKAGYDFKNWIVGDIDAATPCCWTDSIEIEENTAITGYFGNFKLKANFKDRFTYDISDYKYAQDGFVLLRIATSGNTYAYSFNGEKMYYTEHVGYALNGQSVFMTLISKNDYVKDGKLTDAAMALIVKGENEADEADVIDRLGYVNKDGVVNIADANAVYQMVMVGGGYYGNEQLDTKARFEADMDGAGEFYASIADVNAIVNIINSTANPATN